MSGTRRLASAFLLILASPLQAQTVPGLGSVAFPVPTTSRAAQTAFIRGVLLLHLFEYSEAAASFREARRQDPGMTLAYWGEAMTYTHPVWDQQDVAPARAVLAGAPPGKTAREQGYLDAVRALYGDGPKARRDTLYAQAMERLVAANPTDDEARLFYSLALLGLSQGVRNVPTYLRAAAIAESVFARHPRHPGAAHYWIHGMDDPDHAAGALRAARALGAIAPAVGHSQHMTSHIFVALGLWNDVVTANEAAARITGGHSCGHYNAFLHYGYLQQGRITFARELLAACREQSHGHYADPEALDPDAYSFITMWSRHVLDTEDWSGTVARWTIDPGPAPGPRMTYWFTRGLAAARLGDTASARQALAAFDTARQEVATRLMQRPGEPSPNDREFLTRTVVLRFELLGTLHSALDTLRMAAALEDSMPYAYGPPFVNQPSHELYARALMEAGRPALAQAEYALALRRAPRRTAALLGLARAATLAGDRPAADRAYQELVMIWRTADPDLPGLRQARATP